MRIRSLLCICLMFATSISVMGQAEKWNLKDGQGRKTGDWKGFYPGGELRYVGEFEEDQPVDTFTYYYYDGKVKSILIYDPDTAVKSFAIHFYQNGDTLAKGVYKNKQREGVWKILE